MHGLERDIVDTAHVFHHEILATHIRMAKHSFRA